MKPITNSADRRENFRERGFRQIEAWLPKDVHRRVRVATALRGDRSMNDVIVLAIEDWLNRNKIPGEANE